MAYNRLVGLEKGKCAFLGCFRCRRRVELCTYTHARARVRAMFRKQNNGRLGYSGKFRKLNTGFPLLFRKLNTCRDEKTVNGFSRSVGFSYLKSGKRSVYTYTRARVGSVLSLSVFSYPKKLFFLFHSFFIYFFLLFLFSVKA